MVAIWSARINLHCMPSLYIILFISAVLHAFNTSMFSSSHLPPPRRTATPSPNKKHGTPSSINRHTITSRRRDREATTWGPPSYLGFESYPFLCRAYSVSGRGKPTALTGRRMRMEFPASSSLGMSQADASSFHCARRSTFDTSSGGTKLVMTTFKEEG